MSVIASLLPVLFLAGQAAAAPRSPPHVAMLLEDNGDELLPKLTNPTGCPGEGHVDHETKFSGKSSVRIVPMQRFSPAIPDWKYRIVEKPKEGEYRYLRFAWKAPGCSGIMLQMHDLTNWNIRHTAGLDKYGWGTQYVAPKPPEEWTLVTIDLFKGFGERTIRGMALTCFDGDGGYFDHIYLGRTIDDLDRVDATGLLDGPAVELTAPELAEHWKQATDGQNAAATYHSFWTLAAAPAAVPFLAEKLREQQSAAGTVAIRKWITELDDDNFKVRERASVQLGDCLIVARPLLEKELAKAESAEARMRIGALLKRESASQSATDSADRGLRILELSISSEAEQALGELAKGDSDDHIAQQARDAIAPLKARRMP